MKRSLCLCAWFVFTACSNSPEPVAARHDPAASREQGQERRLARITRETALDAQIEVRAVEAAAIRETLTLYGTIKSNAERQQSVRARYPGVVRAVFKRVGERIGRGDTLLTIESNDSLQPYAIVAPISGTVIERNVNPGESVDGSSTLLRLADLSTVWGEFAVFPRDLSRIRTGMPVLVTSGGSDLRDTAKIAFVAPVGSGDTQSVAARVVIDNRQGRWVAGQFVTGELEMSSTRVPVTVRPEALQRLDGAAVVFVETNLGFLARKVTVGRRDVQAAEILQGLSAGERYVSANSYLVKAELQKAEGAGD